MAAEHDPAIRELEEAVREIQERVRARHPEGELGRFRVRPANLLPLLHARDAAEAKVAAIGSVNPRPPGLKNNLVQAWKRFVSRILDWHVREQVEFNRAQMNCVHATMEALNEHNRSMEVIAAAIDNLLNRLEPVEPLPNRVTELEAKVGSNQSFKDLCRDFADIRIHWQEWRKDWERKLAINEIQFLRSTADLQSGFNHRSTLMESNFRESIKTQHAQFDAALERGIAEAQRKLWADLDRIRTEYEAVIHHELRAIRQKAFSAAAVHPAAPPHGQEPPQHPYDFLHFAEKFRGPEEYVRSSFAAYLGYFQGMQRIADLGCGRGEMLELLKENGIPAHGIDGDAESVALCRSKGLDVEEADLFAWLENQPNLSWQVFFCGQVIEHLPPLALPRFIQLCAAKLERGGLLILETPNPECLAIFATHFYLDPTHQRPVPPALASFHMQEAGLGRIEIKRLNPAADSMPSLQTLPDAFRDSFFGCLDYAIIGVKL